MRTGQPEFAVVVMDINGLKTVNDTCGHDFGDILIIDACKLICRTFKRSPVYRIGGDEFVAILENGDLEHYAELLDEFTKGMEGSSSARPGESLSIARGIAVYDAMYQNKAAMKAQAGK